MLVAGVSGFRREPTDNPSAALLAAWIEASTFDWLLSEDIVAEYEEVLERLGVKSARTIVALIREEGQIVASTKKMHNLPDQDDAPFCECAESGDAEFIVTLNPSDFPQNRLRAKVISPADPLPSRARKVKPRRKRLAARKR